MGCMDSANLVGCRSTFKKLDFVTTGGLFDMRSMLLTASRCTSIYLSEVLSCTPIASPMHGASGLDVFALPMKRAAAATGTGCAPRLREISMSVSFHFPVLCPSRF